MPADDPSCSDLDLFELWCAGDTRAGSQLFERHFDSVHRFFSQKVNGELDELVQATFLACVRSRDRFRKECSFRTYLFTIARHELYAYLRRRRRDAERLDFSITSLEDLGITARTRIAHGQERKLLVTALRALPVEQQLLLELHYWEEIDAAELGEIFEVPPTTARTRLFRARQALRERMERVAPRLPELATLEGLETWARRLRSD